MGMRIIGSRISLHRVLARLCWGVVLVVGVALVGMAIAVRFDFGREFAMRRLSAAADISLTAAHTRIAWPYQLVAETVQSEQQATNGAPLLRIRTLRVGRTLHIGDGRAPWCIEAEAAHLVLDTELSRQDGLLSGLAGWRGDAAGLVPALGRARVGDRIVLRESTIEWLDEAGKAAAFAEGVSFRMESARIPEYPLFSIGIDLHRAEGDALLGSGERTWRWLTGPRVPFVDLLPRKAAAAPAPLAALPVDPPAQPPADAPAVELPRVPSEPSPTEPSPAELPTSGELTGEIELAPDDAVSGLSTNLLIEVSP